MKRPPNPAVRFPLENPMSSSITNDLRRYISAQRQFDAAGRLKTVEQIAEELGANPILIGVDLSFNHGRLALAIEQQQQHSPASSPQKRKRRQRNGT